MKTHTDLLDASARTGKGEAVSETKEHSPSRKEEPAQPGLPEPAAPRLGGLFVIAVILAAGAFVLGYFPRSRERAAVKAETRALALQTVECVFPQAAKPQGPLVLSGEVKALQEAAIHARANGYVRRWMVDIGAKVAQGDLLAELDTPETERELAQGRAELGQAEAALALAETTAKRWSEMLAAKTTSSQETDEKLADLNLKRATAAAAAAKVQRLEEMLHFNRITAPFAGVVTMRTLDVGQLVSAGAGKELFRIAQADRVRVFVRVPQNYARAITVGQVARLSFAEMPGRDFEAKVVRTAGSLDPASRTLLTELETDNAKGELLAGSYAQVHFDDAKPGERLTIPANAILFRNDGTMAGVVGADSRLRFHKIALGRDFGSSVEVLSGVEATDRIVVNPPDTLVDGAEVRVLVPQGTAK